MNKKDPKSSEDITNFPKNMDLFPKLENVDHSELLKNAISDSEKYIPTLGDVELFNYIRKDQEFKEKITVVIHGDFYGTINGDVNGTIVNDETKGNGNTTLSEKLKKCYKWFSQLINWIPD